MNNECGKQHPEDKAVRCELPALHMGRQHAAHTDHFTRVLWDAEVLPPRARAVRRRKRRKA